MSSQPPQQQRLEVTLKRPNPLFETWLEYWLAEAERRNAKSQYKLREALQALKSFPLPLPTGTDCGILRGFGTKLCAQIDEELRKRQDQLPGASGGITKTYQDDIKQIVETVRKNRRKKQTASTVAPKISKKAQRALEEEEQRQRQVTMVGGSFRILLLVDTQETNGKHKRTLDQTQSCLKSLHVPYEVRRLTVGDFLWIARNTAGDELVLPYIVERKRMDDLASSVRDGRFHEQKHRLRQCGVQNVIYLVEDYGANEQLGLPLETLQQAMINTQVHSNFTIARTDSHGASMSYLHGMTKTLIRHFKDKQLIGINRKEELQTYDARANTYRLLKFKTLYEDSARNAQLTVREVFVQQLLQLHSLSLEKALAIVEVYATPRLLFDAYEACGNEQEARLLLANITCGELERALGEKLSQTIYDFYETDFKI